MKINFIFLPFLGVTGGLKVIFEHANQLTDMGHQIKVISPYSHLFKPTGWERYKPYFRRLKDYLYLLSGQNRISWFDLEAELVRVPHPAPQYIPDADIVVAGSSQMAEWVLSYPPSKGVRFYLVQGYETWYRSQTEVDGILKNPDLRKIVISTRLYNLLTQKLHTEVAGIALNGVRLNQSSGLGKKNNSAKRILMLNHILEIKGVQDGLKALEIVRERFPEIEIVMFGAYPKRRDFLPRTKYYYQLSQQEMQKLYSSADIFINPSWGGVGLPVLEAMASETAVVTTVANLESDDYVIPDRTALVSPIRRPDLLAQNIIRLLEDEDKLQNLSQAGYEHAKNFTWKNSSRKLEEMFKQALSEKKK